MSVDALKEFSMKTLEGHNWKLAIGDVRDCLKEMPAGNVQCCVTSPPYWGLRDYGIDGQLGLEKTPEIYVQTMVEVFREVRRVLRDDGTFWLNMGDSYFGSWANYGGGNRGAGKQRLIKHGSQAPNPVWEGMEEYRPAATQKHPTIKPKDLVGIPWLLAFALRDDGWWLRSDIIWSKPNPMPESVTDRPTKSHEYIFLFTKSARYFFDANAVKEISSERSSGNTESKMNPAAILGDGDTRHSIPYIPNGTGRNIRSVWTIPTQPYSEAHFATFPEEIPRLCILAGTSEKGCCPECGAPWRRVVDRQRVRTRPGKNSKCYDRQTGEELPDNDKPWASAEVGNRDPGRHVTETKTVGWNPGCKQDCRIQNGDGYYGWPDSAPCIVLDPFAGSCTTLRVAVQLGRRAVGIELSPEYAEMGKRRIEKRDAAAGQTQIAPLDGQKTLF